MSELASTEGRTAGLAAAQAAAEAEIGAQELAGLTKEKVAALRVLFQQIGATAGQAAGGEVARAVLAKINMETLLAEVRVAAAASGEKYAVKAREFQKLAIKIAEDAGGKAGEKLGEQEGGVSGEEAGEISGGEAGRLAGQVRAQSRILNINVIPSFFPVEDRRRDCRRGGRAGWSRGRDASREEVWIPGWSGGGNEGGY